MTNQNRIKTLVLLLLSGILPFACAERPQSAHSLPTIAPEYVGLSSSRLQRVSEKLKSYVDSGKVAGFTVAVMRKGRIAYLDSLGSAKIATHPDSGRVMRTDAIFRIYSMSKPITAVAILMLYESGQLQISDELSKFLPAAANLKVMEKTGKREVLVEQEQPIRIIDLLRHTDGLGYGWGRGDSVDKKYGEAKIWQSEDLTAFWNKVKELPLYHQPGKAWRYGIGLDVAGFVVEKVTGESFADFLQANIFKPLGMRDTGFSVPDAKLDRFLPTYRPGKNGGLEVSAPVPSAAQNKMTTLYSGGGGLVSTTHDYLRFCQMLLNNGEFGGQRIISRKSVELLRADLTPDVVYHGGPVVFPRPGLSFGLGVAVVTDAGQAQILGSKGMYGWSGLAGTHFMIDPQEQMISLLMMQLIPNNHLPIRSEYLTAVYQAIDD